MAITKNSQIDLNGNEMILDADGDTTITADTDDRIDFKIAGTDTLHIDATGLGIGTTSPDGKLDVRGTIFVNGDGTGGRIFASSGNLSLSDGNGRQILRIDDPGSGNSHSHIFDSNGRLGVGTSSTSAEFHVKKNDAGFEVDIDSQVTDGVRLLAYDRDASTDRPMQYRASQQIFYIGSSEAMRIKSSTGQVFIGTSTSVDAGFLVVKANASSYNHIVTQPTATQSYNALAMVSGGGTRIGAISVGTSTNSISYGGTSDYRLKENIVPMEKGLERVKKLKPVKFDWKEDGSSSEGFIAHEIQEAGWEVGVEGQKDGEEMQMVEYGKLTPLLVKAIQEQQTQIEALQSEINTLKGG